MKMTPFALTSLLVLGACSFGTDADRVEQSVAEQLADRGAVEEVSFTSTDDDNMTGFATIRTPTGQTQRMNCTARRTSGANFDWNCVQAIDEALLDEIKGLIRERLSREGEVVQVELERADDDNNAAGYVVVRGPNGEEVRADCRAVRDRPGENLFSWRCGEGADAWAEQRNREAVGGGAGGGDK